MTVATSVPSGLVDPRSIAIDLEFQKRIPDIGESERALLTESIEREGCRDPLIVAEVPGPDGEDAKPVLLDGHNRKAICEELNLQVRVVTLEGITTRDDALAWIDENQLGRRNLSGEALKLIRGRQYNRTKGTHGGARSGEPSNQGENLKASEKVARQTGVSATTVWRDGEFARVVEELGQDFPELETRVLAGSGPKAAAILEAARIKDDHPDLAEQLLKDKAPLSKVKRQVQQAKARADGETSGPRYDVIVVDPLWREKKRGRPKKPSPGEVAPMGEAELSALKLPAAGDCHVFLWTPLDRLSEAMRVLASWKLEYRCAFTWVKPEADVAGQPALNSELILYARRGEPAFIPDAKVETAFKGENCNGRQKPDEFYAMLAGATEGSRLLMFAELGAEGFDFWSGEDETDGSGDDASEIPPDDPGDGSSGQDGRTGEGTLFDDDVPEEALVASHGE